MMSKRSIAIAWSFVVPFLLVTSSCTDSETSTTMEGSCELLSRTEGFGWQVNAQTFTSDGRELTYSQRGVALDDDAEMLEIETTIEADGELLMTVLEAWEESHHGVSVEYGDLVSGLTSATASAEDGVLSGEVNGRPFMPRMVDQSDPIVLVFEDGDPPPDDATSPALKEALSDLYEKASTAAEQCSNVDSNPESSSVLKRGDRGHVSLTKFTDDCIACKGVCSGALAGCAAGAAAGCVAALVAYAACVIPAEVACFATFAGCVGVCNADGQPCCPVGCGDGCCLSGETCLNPNDRLCCDEGQFTCMGNECCDNNEICFDSGPNAGTCCPATSRCGDACCGPTDFCLEDVSLCCDEAQTPCVDRCCDESGCIDGGASGICCEPQNICGSVCCDELDSCIESLSLCCGFNSPACGNKCCNFGESCLDGNTCCPNERVCAGVCCAEGSGCNLQTNTCEQCPLPNTKFCSESGTCCPITEVCTPIPDLCCASGELYCFGACRPANECIL